MRCSRVCGDDEKSHGNGRDRAERGEDETKTRGRGARSVALADLVEKLKHRALDLAIARELRVETLGAHLVRRRAG